MEEKHWESAVNVARELEPHGPTTYRIGVAETLYREVQVTARSVDEALETVEGMYNNGEIVLDDPDEDFAGAEFEFRAMALNDN